MSVISFFKALIRRRGKEQSPRRPRSQKEILIAATSAAEITPYFGSRNGYLREKAVRRAGKMLWPETMPFLLQRLNDWVPQVAAAAEAAVLAFRDADQFEALARCLPQLDDLRHRRRRDHAAFVGGIEDWIAAHTKFQPLAATLQIAVPKISRRLFALASAHHTLPESDLIRLGLQSRDVVTAKLASQRIAQLPAAEQKEFLQKALTAKAGWLRLAALKLLPADEGRSATQNFLLDPYAPCREWAEKHGGFSEDDIKARRRAALEDPSTPPARRLVALKLGGRDALALPLLQPYLDDPRPAFRAAALLSLARLAPQDYESRVKAALTSPVNALSRAAVQAMRDMSLPLGLADWHSFAFTVMSESGARRLLSLARRRNKWDHLGFILELYPHPLFGKLAGQALQGWVRDFNRSPIPMTPQQQKWIAAVRPQYDGAYVKGDSLDFYIR